jgi:hypothetical protein
VPKAAIVTLDKDASEDAIVKDSAKDSSFNAYLKDNFNNIN